MGQGSSLPPPPRTLRDNINNVQRIPLSIIIIIEVGIVFFVGRLLSNLVEGGLQHILTCAIVCICLYLWMFFIYIYYFNGSKSNYPYVFGQVFVIFMTVFSFTTLFIYSIPEMVTIFENTVGYYWVLLTNSTVKQSDGKDGADINNILTPSHIEEDVSSFLYNLTKLNGNFFNEIDLSTDQAKLLYNDDYTSNVESIIKLKYNIGILCWMTIATVISTLLSMEYMSAYI